MAGTDVSGLYRHHSKGNSNLAAMVRRVPIQTQSDTELKPAAAMAEAGSLRNTLDALWRSREIGEGSLVRQVHRCATSRPRETNPVGRKMNIWPAERGRHPLYPPISFRTVGP